MPYFSAYIHFQEAAAWLQKRQYRTTLFDIAFRWDGDGQRYFADEVDMAHAASSARARRDDAFH